MLHDVVKYCLEHHGKRRNPKNGSKYLLLLQLYYFRRYPQYESIWAIFKIPESTFTGILNYYLPKLLSRLESRFITELGQNCTIEGSEDFPECRFIVDSTIQPIAVVSKSQKVLELYYSGKHKIYGLKTQAIVTNQGIAVHITTEEKGGTYEKAIFDESIENFK